MDIEAFILIGGRSTRFGTDKAFHQFDGEAFAMRAASTVHAAFPASHISFVSASEDQFGFKTEGLAWPVVFDLRKGFGAWSGLDAALCHSRAEWTLVLACDLPFVMPAFLQELAERSGVGVDAVVPIQSDGRLQPLCTLYRTSKIRPLVQEMITNVGHLPPVVSLFGTVETVTLAVERDVLKNVNSPADLA